MLTARGEEIDKVLEHVWGPEWFGDPHVSTFMSGRCAASFGDDAASPRLVRTSGGAGRATVTQ